VQHRDGLTEAALVGQPPREDASFARDLAAPRRPAARVGEYEVPEA
jgi:hypothetical protein